MVKSWGIPYRDGLFDERRFVRRGDEKQLHFCHDARLGELVDKLWAVDGD